MIIQDDTLKLVGDDLTTEPYGAGIKDGDTAFKEFVDGTIAEFKSDGRWKKTHEKWVSQYTKEPEEPPTMTLAGGAGGNQLSSYFELLSDNLGELASGMWVTVRLVAIAFAIALGAGTLVAALRVAPNKWLQRLGGIYVETFRNIPLLVLLFISFAGLRRAGVPVERLGRRAP